MPALTIHPVQPLRTVVWSMKAPQPGYVMTDSMHAVKAEVEDYRNKDQLARKRPPKSPCVIQAGTH